MLPECRVTTTQNGKKRDTYGIRGSRNDSPLSKAYAYAFQLNPSGWIRSLCEHRGIFPPVEDHSFVFELVISDFGTHKVATMISTTHSFIFEECDDFVKKNRRAFFENSDISENMELNLTVKGFAFNIMLQFSCSKEEEKEGGETCSVCWEPFAPNRIPRVLNGCGHSLCEQCTRKVKDKCPMCRSSFTESHVNWLYQDKARTIGKKRQFSNL